MNQNMNIQLDFFEESASSPAERFFNEKKTSKTDFSRIDICRVVACTEVDGFDIVYFRITSRGDTGFSDRVENILEANLAENIDKPSPGTVGLVAGIYASGVSDRFVYIATLAKNSDKGKQLQSSVEKNNGDFLIQNQHSGIHIPDNKNYVRLSNSSCAMVFDKGKISIGDKETIYGLSIDSKQIRMNTENNSAQFDISESGSLLSSKGDITLATNGVINLIGRKVNFKNTESLLEDESSESNDVKNDEDHIETVANRYEISAGTYMIKVLSKNIAEYNPIINPISPKPSYVVDILEGGAQFSIGSGDYEINLLNSAPFIGSSFSVNIGTMPLLNSSEMVLETGEFTTSVSIVPGGFVNFCKISLDATTIPKVSMGYYIATGLMQAGFEGSSSKTSMSWGPFGLHSVSIDPTGITIGANFGSMKEQMVLGNSLISTIGSLIDSIAMISVPTAVGVSGPPMNAMAIQSLKGVFQLKCLSLQNFNN